MTSYGLNDLSLSSFQLLYHFLVYTHVCVCAYVCYVCTYVCTYRGQKRLLGILLYHALPYSLEKGFFNLSGAMLVNSLTK